MTGDPAPPDDRTSHLAAVCQACRACFVVVTLPKPVEVAVALMQAARCPDCAGKRLAIALNENHRRAVARLQAEAALR